MPQGTGGQYHYPHSVAAVIQQLRLQLGDDTMHAIGDTAALLDDRDRWVEDNLASLNERLDVIGNTAPVPGIPTGALLDFAGATAPAGFLLCQGGTQSRTLYPDLFTVIGTTWGAGDGSTTFGIPDFRGRVTLGSGTGSGLTARGLGQTGGAETHVLTAAQLPPHSHQINQMNWFGAEASPGTGHVIYKDQSFPQSGNGPGVSTPHNIMQPFVVVTKIIKT